MVQAAGLTNFQTQTLYSYPYPTEVDVKQDQTSYNDQALHSRTLLDGFGRPIESDTYESPTQYIATTQTYDALGRVASVSNPYRTTSDSTYGITTYSYDGLGRTVSMTTPDGAAALWAYSGDLHMATDQAGVTRWNWTDGLGQITEVVENPGGLGYATYDTYAPNGPLTKVQQGSQTRTFTYDALGRLTGSTQPESGSTTYGYDNVNLTSRTDARGITSSYSYDQLNRLLSISYNGGSTYTRNFTYDAAGAGYSWGHLTQVSNSTATIKYLSISPLGQVTASSETTDYETYNFSYYYNRAGALTQENYPSGRVITTIYDYANRPDWVAGTLNGVQTNYVSNVTYYPHGAPTSYTYGNSVWPVFTYNNRLQMNQAWAAVNNNPNNFLFYFAFGYGTTNNNGNVLGINELYGNSVPWGSMTSYSQSFSYDALNRLSSAADSGGWSRSFAYDQFGNAWVPSVSGIGWGVSTPSWNVYNGKNQVSSSTYDQAGNISGLPPGYSFLYDAENRVTSEMGSGQNYFYDGLGQRVTKVVGSMTTDYVYDAFGNLAEEYSPNNTWSKDYIFFNGQPVAIENASANPCATCYLNYDYLGTVRMVTDASATVITRHDYLPFGDEIPAGSAGRNSQFGPYVDNVNQKFTGQYRDSETLNDFFNARYYTAPLMRFLSPDPGNAGADLTDPQTWNAYAYVRNNPLALVDPSGLAAQPLDVNCGVDPVTGIYTCVSSPSLPGAGGGVGVGGGGGGAGGGTGQPCSLAINGPEAHALSANAAPCGGNGGSGSGGSATAKRSTAQRFACAAQFGQNHSFAAAFGAQNNFVANLFGGNSVSGLVNLGLFVSGAETPTAAQLAAIPLKGAAQGIPVPPGNPGLSGAAGQVRGLAVQGAVSAGYNAIAGVGAEPIELGITASGTVATPAAQLSAETLGNVAFGVGAAKFAWDLGTVVYGYTIACR